MKTPFLLPHRSRLPLGLLVILFGAFWIAAVFGEFELPFLAFPVSGENLLQVSNDNYTDEIALTGLIACLLLFCLTAEKKEDEYVRNVRLRALSVAVCIHYILAMLIVLLSFGSTFLLLVYLNMFSTLISFLTVYYLQLHLLPRLQNSDAIA